MSKTTKPAAAAAPAAAPVVAQPTVEQIIAAFAAALLPLAGPTGIAVASLVPALQQLLDTFQNHGSTDYTVDDLIAVVQKGNTDLQQLQATQAAQAAAAGGQ